LRAETDFLFAVVTERQVKSPPSRQTTDQKATPVQTIEADYDDDSAGAVDRELRSEQLVPASEQDDATRPERGVRLTIRKQAVHGKGTVPEPAIAVEIARRSGEDDLAVRLQGNPYRPFLRVRAHRLANKTAASESAVQPPTSVESNEREPSSNSAADQHAAASLHSNAARCIRTAERDKGTPTTTERRVK